MQLLWHDVTEMCDVYVIFVTRNQFVFCWTEVYSIDTES
jgi:hypothetical protein